MTTRRIARPLLAAALLALTGVSHANAVDSKDNAALGYWRAFSLVTPDNAKAISAFNRDAIGAADFTIEDESVRAIVRNDDIVTRLIEAAGKPDCDFAIDYERGIYALLPHLGPMRTSALILILRARLDLAEGDAAHATESLEAVLRSSEHLVDEDTLISSLVSMAIFASAQPVIEYGVAQGAFDAAQRATLRAAFDRFAKDDPFRVLASIRREKSVITDFVRTSLQGEAGLEAVRVAGDSPAARRLAEQIANNEDLAPQIALYQLFMDQATAALESRDLAAIQELEKGIDAGVFGDVAATFAPGFSAVHRNLLRSDELIVSLRETLAH